MSIDGHVDFNNLDGVIVVDRGTLSLAGLGISSNGIFSVASGAMLDLTGGNGPTWAGGVGGDGPFGIIDYPDAAGGRDSNEPKPHR